MKKSVIHLVAAAAILPGLLIGCAPQATVTPPPVGDQLVWASHGHRPDWVISPPEHDVQEGRYLFVGMSYRHATERSAREAALANAATQVVRHATTMAQKEFDLSSEGKAYEGRTLTARINSTDKDHVEAIGLLKESVTRDVYIEQWRKGAQPFFKAYVLLEVSEDNFSQLVHREE